MEPQAWHRSAFRLGTWRVEPLRTRLTNGTSASSIEPKVMQVLLCLARRPGEVVTRAELMETVWDGVVVGDETLTRAVSELRRALDDDAREPHYIETIPRVGYRLIADVSSNTSDHAPATSTPRPPSHTAPTRPGRWGLGAAFLVLVLLGLAIGGVLLGEPTSQDSTTQLQAAPFTTLPGKEIDPAFSPDGSRIAFARQEPGETGWHLMVKGRGGERVLSLTPPADAQFDRYPTWSPRGDHIVFARMAGDACVIYSLPALGGPMRQMTACSAGSGVAGIDYAPDGHTVVYAEQDPRASTVRLFALDVASHQTRLLFTQAAASIRTPIVTPGGTRVAFILYASPGVSDVYEVPLAGNEPAARLTHSGLSFNGLTWKPGGDSFVLSSYHGSNYNLWRIPLVGGDTRRIATGLGSLSSPAYSRNGRELVYVRWNHDTNVWRMPAGDTAVAPEAWLVSTQADLLPQLSPDGRRIAFVSERSGLPALWIREVEDGEAFSITGDGGYFSGPVQWSPDGQHIAYTRADVAHARLDVYVVDVRDGTTQQITNDDAAEMAPFWSPEGHALYFGSNRSGAWHLWQVTVQDAGRAGAAPRQVPGAAGMAGQLAPDGRTLYFVRPDTRGLWKVPLAGGTPEHLDVPLDPVQDAADWVVTPRGIYFVLRTPAHPSAIALYDLDDGGTTITPTPKVIQRNSGLTVSPDGRWVYYTQEDRMESDLMIASGGLAAAQR